MRHWTWLAAAGLLTMVSCSSQKPVASTKVPLTEHQRDSVLAKSQLPGAFVVGRAMTVSDKVANAPSAQMPPDDSNEPSSSSDPH